MMGKGEILQDVVTETFVAFFSIETEVLITRAVAWLAVAAAVEWAPARAVCAVLAGCALGKSFMCYRAMREVRDK